MLTPVKKQKRVEICEELLKCYHEEGDQFLLNIVVSTYASNTSVVVVGRELTINAFLPR